MKTLVVAPFLPYPLVFGGAIRLYNMIRMLGYVLRRQPALVPARGTGEDPTEHLETICRRVVISDSRPPSSALRRARSLASAHSYQLLGPSQRRAAARARPARRRRATTTWCSSR